jgi:hypothetical protein
MGPGVAGTALMVTPIDLGELVPQLLAAVTLIDPFCPPVPVVTIIDEVP